MGGGRDPLTDFLDHFTQWPSSEDCRIPDPHEEQGDVWTLVSPTASIPEDTEVDVCDGSGEVDRLPGNLTYEDATEAEQGQDPAFELGGRKVQEGNTTKSLSPGFQELGTDMVDCDLPPCQPANLDILADNEGGANGLAAGISIQEETVFSKDVPEIFGPFQAQGLYKLMHVKTDRIDTSLVEKMLVSAEQIVALCQEIAADSASFEDDSVAIDFEALNQHTVHVVGLYGSKKVLSNIFERLKLVDNITLRGMACDNLETGLYGILRGRMLYVFYWHHGPHLEEGSRLSCNFIRYVADLCETVYICLDDKALSVPCLSSGEGMKMKKKQRTQRLQVAVVKDSENAVSLHPGFQVYPEVPANREAEEEHPEPLKHPPLKLCEGRDRTAMLYPVFHP